MTSEENREEQELIPHPARRRNRPDAAWPHKPPAAVLDPDFIRDVIKSTEDRVLQFLLVGVLDDSEHRPSNTENGA